MMEGAEGERTRRQTKVGLRCAAHGLSTSLRILLTANGLSLYLANGKTSAENLNSHWVILMDLLNKYTH